MNIFEAARLGEIERVKQIILEDPQLVNKYERFNLTTGKIATQEEIANEVIRVLKMPTRDNIQEECEKNIIKITPIFVPILYTTNNSVEIVKLLCESGADVNACQINTILEIIKSMIEKLHNKNADQQ